MVQKKHIPNIAQLKYLPRYLNTKEKSIIRSAGVLIVFVAIAWFGFFIAGRLENTPAFGGEYTEGIVGRPEHLNPIYSPTNSADADVVRLVYSGLLFTSPQGELQTDLAESYQTNDKQTEYVFKLKQGVLWHDGEPFGADDVIYTLETIKDSQTGSPLRAAYQGVKITKVDDSTIKFVLEKPFAPFLSFLTVGILPAHIWEEIQPANMALSTMNLKPVGTGPFAFEQSTKDSSGLIKVIKLKRNENFYKDKAYLARVILNFYESSETALNDVLEQKIDGMNFLPYASKNKIEKKFLNENALYIPQYTAIFLNQKQNEALKDKNVRKALELAINKQELVSQVLEGVGETMSGPFSNLTGPGASATSTPIVAGGQNIEEAKKLLVASKWAPIDKNAFIDVKSNALLKSIKATASSTPEIVVPSIDEIKTDVEKNIIPTQNIFWKNGDAVLEVELVTANSPILVEAATRVAAFWESLGVITKLNFIEPKSIIRETIKDRSYDALLFGQIMGHEMDLYPFWHSSQSEYPGLNLSVFSDRDLDAMLIATRESITPDKRAEAMKKIQQLLTDKLPAIFLYSEPYRYITNKRIQGIQTTRIGSPADRWSDVAERFIKTKKVWKKGS